MKTVLIVYNHTKPDINEKVSVIAKLLASRGYQPLSELDYQGEALEFIITMGGDGTILRAVREYAIQANVPILPVSLGTLSFMGEIEFEKFESVLSALDEQKMVHDERCLIQLTITNQGKVMNTYQCLNDVVVTSLHSRLTHFQLSIENKQVAKYRADGIIISTPTGSTAYNLSAGGPILNPRLNNLVITPICAHMLTMRPMVIDLETPVLLKFDEEEKITIDGQVEVIVQSQSELKVEKSDKKLCFLRFHDYSFYEALNKKLKWEL